MPITTLRWFSFSSLLKPAAASLTVLAFAGCGSTATAANGGDGGTTTTVGGDDGGGAGDATPAGGSVQFKTFVILGDSISDGGGQAPFYYDLLLNNDNTKYPADTGKDLSTRYPGIVKVKNSKAGAQSINLIDQAKSLPTTLAGPVLVVITIGGNDVQSALPGLLAGGSDASARASFASNLDDSFGELTKADRFGPGVKTYVLVTNVYDPSDGTGNFHIAATGRSCPGVLGFFPAGKATEPLLTPWETVMTTEAAKYPNVTVLDLRARFHGHGVENATDNWFYSDCIHPDAAGHDQVRGIFWDAISKL